MTHDTRRGLVLAVAGPAAAGAATGFRSGLGDMLQLGATLPALAAGITALTLPALYVATTYTGTAPSLDRLARAVGRALSDAGAVLLGLSPALLFLGASSSSELVRAWAFIACACAAFVAVRTVEHDALVSEVRTVRTHGVFVAWSLLTAAVGAILVFGALFSSSN